MRGTEQCMQRTPIGSADSERSADGRGMDRDTKGLIQLFAVFVVVLGAAMWGLVWLSRLDGAFMVVLAACDFTLALLIAGTYLVKKTELSRRTVIMVLVVLTIVMTGALTYIVKVG